MQYRLPTKFKLVGECMLRPLLSILLSLLLMVMPAMGDPSGDQTAGQVKALIPDATRNAQPLAVKDTLQWNDLLKTDAKGRVRIGFTDGTFFNFGSNSEGRVVQHDAKSQQTSIELTIGQLRNQVVKITQPGGKYEVKTPNAVIGVRGTDFYVGYENGRTTVICYAGLLAVTPTTGTETNNPTTVTAGQMVVIGAETPPGGYQATAIPAAVMQTSILNTNIPEQALRKGAAVSSHRTRNILIGVGAVAAGWAIVLSTVHSSQPPCGCGK